MSEQPAQGGLAPIQGLLLLPPPAPAPAPAQAPAPAPAPAPASAPASASELAAQPPKSVPEQPKYKSKLQELTQRASIPRPQYCFVNESSMPHAPQFRSTVLVDGTYYTSPSTFSQRRVAEQDAARVALDNISQKIKDDGHPLVCEDTTFCKQILNEYSVKLQTGKPTYHTEKTEGCLPAFVSSVDFNGVLYSGRTAKRKKEAEQLAARAAILSILASDPAQTMRNIIKSKHKLYVALNKENDNNSVFSAALSFLNTEDSLGVDSNKRKEAEVTGIPIDHPLSGISQPSLDELAKFQAAPGSSHAFKKPRSEASTVETTPAIVFVPAGSDQFPISLTTEVKQSRKSRKKARKRLQHGAQIITAAVPLRQIPPCSVTTQ